MVYAPYYCTLRTGDRGKCSVYVREGDKDVRQAQEQPGLCRGEV